MKYRVITGRIQATQGGYKIANYAEYLYITFIHDDGKVEQIKNVNVFGVIDSFVTPGKRGRFYLFAGGFNQMVGFEDSEVSLFAENELTKEATKNRISGFFKLLFLAGLLFISFLWIRHSAQLFVICAPVDALAAWWWWRGTEGRKWCSPQNALAAITQLGFGQKTARA